MSNKTLSMPEDVLVNMLKTLPESVLADIFWRTLMESDTSPLTQEERKAVREGKREFEKGETIKIEDTLLITKIKSRGGVYK